MIFNVCKLFLDHPISMVNKQGLAVKNGLKSTSLKKSQFFADCLMDGQVCWMLRIESESRKRIYTLSILKGINKNLLTLKWQKFCKYSERRRRRRKKKKIGYKVASNKRRLKKVLNSDFAQNWFWEKSLVQKSNYCIHIKGRPLLIRAPCEYFI